MGATPNSLIRTAYGKRVYWGTALGHPRREAVHGHICHTVGRQTVHAHSTCKQSTMRRDLNDPKRNPNRKVDGATEKQLAATSRPWNTSQRDEYDDRPDESKWSLQKNGPGTHTPHRQWRGKRRKQQRAKPRREGSEPGTGHCLFRSGTGIKAVGDDSAAGAIPTTGETIRTNGREKPRNALDGS